jgi:hypothetical protein
MRSITSCPESYGFIGCMAVMLVTRISKADSGLDFVAKSGVDYSLAGAENASD